MIKYKGISDYLKYNSISGELTWLKGRMKGRVAKSVDTRGYLRIRYKNKLLLGHRVCWFLFHGDLPDVIDHVNGNTLDNRMSNLRESCNSTNNMNRTMHKNNKSGVKCVSWCKRNSNWRVIIGKDGIYHSFGCYTELSEAKQVADANRRLLHGDFSNDGVH